MDELEVTFSYTPEKPYSEPTEQEKIRSSEGWRTIMHDSTLTMVFAPPRFGWFDWLIHGDPRGGLVDIRCSEVYDPCPEIVRWMHDIAADRLPATLTVDEEGREARFSLTPASGRPGWAELEIIRDFQSGPKGPPPKLIFFTRVQPRQLVAQFARRWTDWLNNDYVAKEWHQFHWTDDMDEAGRDQVANPATLDLTALHQVGGADSGH